VEGRRAGIDSVIMPVAKIESGAIVAARRDRGGKRRDFQGRPLWARQGDGLIAVVGQDTVVPEGG
jgi:hypothetical protein